MYRKICRALSMALAVCLMLSAGIPSALAGRDLSDIIDLNDYPSSIKSGLVCDLAIKRGNDAFAEGDYETARGYYVFALRKINKSQTYGEGDVCNNLVLALLYLGETQTAYDLCRYMLDEDLAPAKEDRYGYMLNMLVCAHANGLSAAGELEHAREEGYFSFEDLAELAENQPKTFSGLLTAIVYNVLYIDMEGSVGDGAETWAYFPDDLFEDADVDDARDKLASGDVGRKEYLEYIYEFLLEANQWFNLTYSADDPDIMEMILYVEALRDEAAA
ncbi:MAG: hypothetical protein IKI84_11225 [Clostridia bacterium]|nr:hypothetical protein [Clostridia bacterium]